jgi:methanogenic corrinoid protein MtbC1
MNMLCAIARAMPAGTGVCEHSAVSPESIQALLGHLLAERRSACSQLVERLCEEGHDHEALYEGLLRPVMHEVGVLWEQNLVTVAREHVATAIVEGLLHQLLQRASPVALTGRRALVACVEGELHQVGARMVADTLELRGWDTRFVGAGVPLVALERMAEEHRPHLLGLSMAMSWNRASLNQTLAALSHIEQVVVGGHFFESRPRALPGASVLSLSTLVAA